MTPWTFEEARRRCQVASMAQGASERALRLRAREAAEAEETYRMALTKAIVEVHDGGAAWTVAQDLARGRADVAELRRLRDIAEGVREAQQQVAWRRAADRKDAQRFADWSQRRELADPGVDDEPTNLTTYGARAA